MEIIQSLKPQPFRLVNQIQHYSWGSRGSGAFIPHLLGIQSEINLPYAELWMGVHPNAPSQIILGESSIPLPELIKQYPLELLGHKVSEQFSGQFPFLFKVLSANEALSIQAHPDKKQAEALHRSDPHNYPDDNHKPEMAIAIDELTSLVGLKKYKDILATLNQYPAISEFIGTEIVQDSTFSSNINPKEIIAIKRKFFQKLFDKATSDPHLLLQTISQIEEQILSKSCNEEVDRLFLDLRKKYIGADVGLILIFFLNLIYLRAGQAVFLGAGIPHAYIKGNIIECMANSDNVVRAGLTRKFQDIDTFVKILDFSREDIPILSAPTDSEHFIYAPNVQEFSIHRYQLNARKSVSIRSHNKPEILLQTEGEAQMFWPDNNQSCTMNLKRGQSVFIPAFLDRYDILSSSRSVVFRAIVPL